MALFTIAETWKQPNCLSAYERIKKMWYLHTMECCSAAKIKGNLVNCNNMDETGGQYTKGNKPQRFTNTASYHLYAES